MTNEMMRPFNVPTELGSKLRDALTFNTVEIRLSHMVKDKHLLEITWASNGYRIGYDVAQCDTYQEAVRLQSLFLDALYVARNAPVLATGAVLAGLPDDAKVMTRTHFIEKGCSGYWGYWEPNDYGDFDLEPVNGERIQAHNDPKTANYLRQFTLEGVRRVG